VTGVPHLYHLHAGLVIALLAFVVLFVAAHLAEGE